MALKKHMLIKPAVFCYLLLFPGDAKRPLGFSQGNCWDGQGKRGIFRLWQQTSGKRNLEELKHPLAQQMRPKLKLITTMCHPNTNSDVTTHAKQDGNGMKPATSPKAD